MNNPKLEVPKSELTMSELSTSDKPESDKPGSDKQPPDFALPLLDSLLLVARSETRYTSEASVVSGLPIDGRTLPPELFVRAANRAGLAATLQTRALKDIPNEVLPAILVLRDGNSAVLTELDYSAGIAVVNPGQGKSLEQVDIASLEEGFAGDVFYVRPMQNFDQRTPKIYADTEEHWFWGVLKSSWTIYRDVLIASFLINLFVLAQPLFVMNVYDRVVPNNAFETLWALAIGVVIVYLFDWALKNLRAYFVEIAAKRTDVILSAQLFERVMGLKMWHRPTSVGAFANRLQDFDTLKNFVTSSTILTLIDIPFLIIFLIFIGWLGKWVVLVPLTIIPIALYIAWRTQKKLKPMIENVMRSAAKKNATLVESLVGTETIKSLGSEGQMQRSWEQSVGYMSQWGLQSRMTSNMSTTSVQLLQSLAMVGVVVVGVYLIAERELTMGGLIACVILNGRALASLGQMAGLIASYNHAEATLHSLDALMELPLEREKERRYLNRPEFDGGLQLKNISFSYPEQPFPALKDINLKIAPGEKIAVI
ncbi:MAG: ABC transporter transmembrane domain-containing protein, partial [bacterium]